jgi:hypothetical protein
MQKYECQSMRETLTRLNRRYSLGSAIAAGSSIRSSALASPNDTLRAACVGVRGHGRNHTSAFAGIKNVEIDLRSVVSLCGDSVLNSQANSACVEL